MKDELGRKLMNSFPHWEQKHKDKKGKFTKRYVIKQKLKFKDYKNGLEVNQGIKKWTF